MAKIFIPCEFEGYVAGQDIYRKTLTPVIKEELSTKMKPENPHEKYDFKNVEHE